MTNTQINRYHELNNQRSTTADERAELVELTRLYRHHEPHKGHLSYAVQEWEGEPTVTAPKAGQTMAGSLGSGTVRRGVGAKGAFR